MSDTLQFLTESERRLQATAVEPYFQLTCDGRVTYLAGPDADRYEARVDLWQARFGVVQIDIMKEGTETSLGSRKTPTGALRLLVKLADGAYSTR